MTKGNHKLGFRLAGLCLAVVLWGTAHAWGFTEGKTYDKSNIQEIKEFLIPEMVKWIEKDGWIINTYKLSEEVKFDDEFLNLCKQNEGRYKMQDGMIKLKNGQDKGNIQGLPFPTIDVGHPDVAQMIMENFKYRIYRCEGEMRLGSIRWIGSKGLEREVQAEDRIFYWQGRRDPIPNPRNYLFQEMLWVAQPYELRGTVSLCYSFDSGVEDSQFAFVPMLRRVRRMSAATRSDPWMGSDNVNDDINGWGGKNMSMNWKFIGKKNILVPFMSSKIAKAKSYSDGSIDLFRGRGLATYGYQDKTFTGVPWAPLSYAWTLRPVYVVEGHHKDPYYNFGRQIFYVDSDLYVIHLKVCYDQAGQYWRTFISPYMMQKDEKGRFWTFQGCTIALDDKMSHASLTSADPHIPEESGGSPDRALFPATSEYGINFYNDAQMRQLTK